MPVRSAYAWATAFFVVFFGCAVVGVIWLFTAPFDPGRYAAGRAFRWLAIIHTATHRYWHFEISGERVRDPRRPYVAVSNHESYADIFLISHLPWEMKWLSKETIFKIPFMGWLMRMAGDIPIRRGKRDSVASALTACRDRLAKRVSVMIFPEGTRSPTAEMLPFKNGAFQLAIEAGVPILPIAVAGTRHAMAKGSFRFQRARARCHVLPPIDTAGLTLADVPALREQTRARIEAARRALAAELGIGVGGDPELARAQHA
jgi:1-acyl-sn-glycerol-3-phosphate acyltransferase